MVNKNVSYRLAQLRKQAGLSIAQLSRILGVAPSYLSLLESGGRSNPSLDMLEKLCGFYGVNRDWLLDGTGAPFSPMTPEVATERLDNLLRQLNQPGGEADLRESKTLAEIRIRLSQLKHSDAQRWAQDRAQIIQIIDEYAAFCREHFAEVKMALLKVGRAHADAPKTAGRKPKGRK